MTAPQPQPRSQTASPRGRRTRQRILGAAEALFAERGYEGTTLRDVASTVGIRNPSLYNHFASKDGLYSAVLERGIGPLLGLLSQLAEAPPESRLDSQQVVARAMEILSARPALARLVLHETLAGGQRLTPMLRAYIGPIFATAIQAAGETPGAERWGAERLPLLVLAIYHMVVGYFTIAPLYESLSGLDLLSGPALERQTILLGEIVETLFASPAAQPAD